jgi:hypothetical protein
MWVILIVWLCIGAAFLLPPSVTFWLFLGLAGLRLLYLTRHSAIEAAAEVCAMPGQVVADVRRNGLDVLKTVLGWLTAIAALATIVVVFKIPF